MTGSHRIGAIPFWRRVWASSSSFTGSRAWVIFLAASLILQLTSVFVRETLGPRGSVALLMAGALLLLGILAAVAYVRNPPPVIDFDDGVLRIGSEATPFSDVTEAFVIHYTHRKRDELALWLGGHRRRHTMVVLRGARGALDEKDRAVLAEMVQLSGIRLPEPKPDPYDPKGKFAWLDQQWYSTKQQVLDAILRTPERGDVER